MTIDKDRVLIVSNHHRRSCFFETSMAKLHSAGYKHVYIQNTGSGTFCNYDGPAMKVWSLGPVPYDTGMMELHKRLDVSNYDIIVLMDNDLFISGVSYFERYLRDFVEGSFDYSCHMVSATNTREAFADHDKTIKRIDKLSIIKSEDIYGFYPEPHFENAYLLASTKLWSKLKTSDFCNSRQMLKAIFESGANVGAHYSNYVGMHSHFGEEWFHVGALMQFYHHLESGNVSKISKESTFDMSRIGYFLFMEDVYGDILPQNIKRSISSIINDAGNRDEPLKHWRDLVSGTCMTSWNK